jgi:hypothetical protein
MSAYRRQGLGTLTVVQTSKINGDRRKGWTTTTGDAAAG